MLEKEEILLIIYLISVILLLLIFVLIFSIAFIRRKNKLLFEKIQAKQRFDKELSTARVEIQEQTLKNIAWELHDNVGQLLSVVNMQLNILSDKIPVEFQNELIESKKLVATTVNEVRTLSKTLNTDVVLKNGLVASLELELERFKRLNFLKVNYTMGGEITDIIKSDEIIIFRTLQEFLSNVIRHAGAENLFVNLSFNSETLDVEIRDDGIGFDTEKVVTSNGMQTMKSRAELIKADFLITSKIGEGTKLYLKYPYKYEW